MLRVSTSVKRWHCPKLGCEVGLRIETLQDQATGKIHARKFECDMALRCSLPVKEGSLSQHDYSTCECPEALASLSAGDTQA